MNNALYRENHQNTLTPREKRRYFLFGFFFRFRYWDYQYIQTEIEKFEETEFYTKAIQARKYRRLGLVTLIGLIVIGLLAYEVYRRN